MFSQLDQVLSHRVDSESSERIMAATLFEEANHRTLWKSLWRRVSGKDSRLLSLSATGAAGRGGHRTYVGIRQVPLCLIRGSENRERDFDVDFNPLQAHDRDRWIGVLLAMKNGVALPPVELIQVGELFYVRDGHHRISAARQMGLREIEAEVTIWQPE